MMDEVDRVAATKDLKDTGEIVNRECVTIAHSDAVDRSSATVASPSKITFFVCEPAPSRTALLRGIPTKPLLQTMGSQVLFGRGNAADVFFNDETASREHMKLFVQKNPDTQENEFVVQTVNATNPVFINGRRLLPQDGVTALNTKDKLRAGQLEFIIYDIAWGSMESFQIEFVRNPQQFIGQANATANHLGAVNVYNNLRMPTNPPFNINISPMQASFAPMVAPYQGMQVAPLYNQPITVNPGFGQFFPQTQPTHQRCHTYYSQPFQETSPMRTPSFPQQEQTSAKHPTEQSENTGGKDDLSKKP
ncbi:hypothetical protein P5673_006420 [Acropora cervicornis]|uniref:FHA domain-containing protein n=1 Tax=Acropora cervicornis TaxID=6130 RepID=A0AAD9QY98_ACRCE|nr:hypothetical protein P5673_006420 [Acropora cervicornis]